MKTIKEQFDLNFKKTSHPVYNEYYQNTFILKDGSKIVTGVVLDEGYNVIEQFKLNGNHLYKILEDKGWFVNIFEKALLYVNKELNK